MRAIAFGLYLSLVFVACGSDGDGSSVYGDWLSIDDGTYDCATGLTLNKQRYVLSRMCSLQGGGYGVQLEAGALQVDDDALTLTPDQASCPRAAGVATYYAQVDDDQLFVTSDQGAVIFDRNDAEAGASGGVQITYGCWDGATFTPGQVVDL